MMNIYNVTDCTYDDEYFTSYDQCFSIKIVVLCAIFNIPVMIKLLMSSFPRTTELEVQQQSVPSQVFGGLQHSKDDDDDDDD